MIELNDQFDSIVCVCLFPFTIPFSESSINELIKKMKD